MTDRDEEQHSKLQIKSQVEAKPKSWLVVFDYLFYVVAVVVGMGFVYYLFSFRHLLLLYLPVFLQAMLITLVISLISMVIATIFGFIGAQGRLSRLALVRWSAVTYVEITRGTPLLVQLSLWYYGVGLVLSNLGFDPHTIAFKAMTVLQNNSLVPDAFNGYFYGIIGLSFNYGAYLTEVFRTGIASVERGQTEAALSLGLDAGQAMWHIVLPQAIRLTIPPFTNNFITLIQDSALLSILSVIELEHTTFGLALPQIHVNDKFFVFIFGALFYFVLCYPLALLARYFEMRMATAY